MGVHLLAAIFGHIAVRVEQVVLIAEFLASKDHRYAHGRQQARKRRLIRFSMSSPCRPNLLSIVNSRSF